MGSHGDIKMKGLTKKQRDILIGMVMGDAYLQATGKSNARLRLEHSVKQKNYIEWKYDLLKGFMQSPPKLIRRFNPVWKRTYQYYRCQSNAGPYFGKLRRQFYDGRRKIIPSNILSLLATPLALAVWYMDDGYYYHRDDVAYIYLSRFEPQDFERLIEALKKNFGVLPSVKIKKGKYPCFVFDKAQTTKIVKVIKPHIIPSMRYKLPKTP